MKQENFGYLLKPRKTFDEEMRRITYSYNNIENTIIGHVEENGDIIVLYEYRGKYYGTEFLISFSKNSASYRLIQEESTTAKEEEELPN